MQQILFWAFLIIFPSSYFSNQVPFQKNDYIIYGVYCGECEGRCSVMFKLDSKHLFIDTTDSFFKYSEQIIFNGDTLNTNQFHQAEILKTKIPKFLIESKQTKFGNPDEYDQCGIYFQIKIGDKLKTFHIDKDLKSIPQELHEYVKLIIKLSSLRLP